ncbi:hypothetical protein BMETH_1948_0 [methanotrophic bacterial endosymbiont of Bathymodiolus sp.]|nr:hypothetical protein BMETH_1948_0 [methanotrophic bacterial endosymbiont of Bathymodiolus sp.]
MIRMILIWLWLRIKTRQVFQIMPMSCLYIITTGWGMRLLRADRLDMIIKKWVLLHGVPGCLCNIILPV